MTVALLAIIVIQKHQNGIDGTIPIGVEMLDHPLQIVLPDFTFSVTKFEKMYDLIFLQMNVIVNIGKCFGKIADDQLMKKRMSQHPEILQIDIIKIVIYRQFLFGI